MSEYLSFSKSGQWELHKATTGSVPHEPKSDYVPGSKKFNARSSSNLNGDLPKDIGTKGQLHDNGGGQRPKQGPNFKHATTPARQMESQFTARNPGVGD